MARFKRFVPLLILLLAVLAVFASGATRYLNLEALQANEAALRAFVDQQLPLALLTFVVVYALATAVSLPPEASALSRRTWPNEVFTA